jgi:hypothetical protein
MLFIQTQFQFLSHTGQLMWYSKIIALCSKVNTKHNWSVGNWRFSPYRAVNTLRLGYKNQWTLYREINADCCEVNTKHTTGAWAKKIIALKGSIHTAQKTHFVSVIKTSQLMLHRKIIAVCSEIHTEHINTLCGQNEQPAIVTTGANFSAVTEHVTKPSNSNSQFSVVSVATSQGLDITGFESRQGNEFCLFCKSLCLLYGPPSLPFIG